MNRRKFITSSMFAGAGISMAARNEGKTEPRNAYHFPKTCIKEPEKIRLIIFSKNLQWLDYDAMASTAADLGFDGIDLTVRPGGHVLPERVAEDLPRANESIKKAGLKIYNIVTSIENAEDPLSEKILQTARSLNIANYRMGWFQYEKDISIENNLKNITEKMRKLEVLNAHYQLHGAYQNHSGHYFGAPVWDLAEILKKIDAQWTGSQYDIYHAAIEGANSWVYGFEMLQPYIKMVNIKDFQWAKRNGKWVSESVPLGEGIVDFNHYLSLLQKNNISCPVSVHYEYPLGGADQGMKTLTVNKKQVLTAMRKDLIFLKGKLITSGMLN